MRFSTMWYVRPVYALSDQSLCLSLEYSMTDKRLTKHHLEFLSLKRVFYVFVLSCVYVFVRVCLYVPCGHLLGKG